MNILRTIQGAMSNRAKPLLVALVITLLMAASASYLLWDSNSRLKDDQDEVKTELLMRSLLADGQFAVEDEIEKVRNLTYELTLKLSVCGLNGTEAREEINATLALNPYAIDILTFDMHGVVQAIEPEKYRYMEGVDLSGGNKTNELLTYKVPTMSNTFASRGISRGAGYACPVFGPNGVFLGAVSTLFDVGALMNASLPSLTEGTAFTWFAMQPDGTIIYDEDASQIGLNTFTDPAFANFTELIELGRQAANEPSGHGTYSFMIDLGTEQVVSKECFWTTVGAETIEWRLFLVRSLE